MVRTRVLRAVRFVAGTVLLALVLVAAALWWERAEVLAPVATVTPQVAALTATPTLPPTPDPRAKPVGYDQSCARAQPWGEQVRAPFVCIDAPAAGTTVTNGAPLSVRGYAGGSFEHNVVVEWRVTRADGSTLPGPAPRVPLTYTAPDSGMPGAWQLSMNLNETGLPARLRITAFFESPRDGSRVAEASVEATLR